MEQSGAARGESRLYFKFKPDLLRQAMKAKVAQETEYLKKERLQPTVYDNDSRLASQVAQLMLNDRRQKRTDDLVCKRTLLRWLA